MEDNIFKGIKKEMIKLPLDIIKDYADQFNTTFNESLIFEIKEKLEDDTDDWFKGDVFGQKADIGEKKMVIRAYIVAPELESYRLLIMKISYYRSTVYPCELFNSITYTSESCDTSEELNARMKDIFVSEEFKKPIRILLSQIDS